MFTEYHVYADASILQLEKTVNAAIKDNWQPLGGITVVQNEVIVYLQSMAR